MVGRPIAAAHSTRWLRGYLECGKLLAYRDFLATVTPVLASLLLGEAWQIRDLCVLPDTRRQGAASSLIEHVTAAAVVGGALRISLRTELLYKPLMSDPPATM